MSDRTADVGVKAGSSRLVRERQSQRLSIGDGEVVVLVAEDVSWAHDLLDTVLPSGEEFRRHAPGLVRHARVDPLLTVRDNLEVPLRQAGVTAATARQQIPVVAESLDLVDSLDTRAMILSTDQRERVRLALEAIKPTALLLPDDFARLPRNEVRTLRAKIVELRRILGGRTLLVEEILDDIRLGADRIAIAGEEKVRQVGSPRHVYDCPIDLYTAARFGRHSLLLADAQGTGRDLITPLGRVILPQNFPDLARRRLLIGLRPDSLSAEPSRHGQLRLAMRVSGAPTPEQPGEVDPDWSRSFVLPTSALRAGLAPRVAGVSLPGGTAVGQQLRLTADPSRIMLFDAATGENVLGDHTLGDFGEVTVEAVPSAVVIGQAPDQPDTSSLKTRPPREEPPAGRVRRFLSCDHPPSVQRGSDFVIRTQVTVAKSAGGRAFDTDPIPPEGVELIFVLYADRFVARTDATISRRLPRNGDTEPGAFVLTAPTKTGRYRLLLRVFRGNAQLAEQPLTIEVSEDPTAPSGEPSIWPLADVALRPHVVRLIIVRAGRKYQYVLASDDPSIPSIYASKLAARSPNSQLSALIKSLSEMAAGKGMPPTEIREALRSEGQELWLNFIPEELATGLQNLDVARNIIWISTFGEIEKVPWEMLHPIEKIGGRNDFLAQIFPTVRSPAGTAALVDELAIRRAEVVLPDPSLQEATAEVSAIRDILAGRADVGADIREKAKLRLVLEGGGFSLLHVAGHNDYGKGSGLILAAGQRLRPPDLNGLASAGGRWAATHPLVFLNACGTDRSERTYTGVTDWAHKCFDAGAAAFVGSLWDVRSAPARAFATCFYQTLFEDGQPLAAAAHLAREQARRRNSKDPTWLAYTVYGNPFARAVNAGAPAPVGPGHSQDHAEA